MVHKTRQRKKVNSVAVTDENEASLGVIQHMISNNNTTHTFDNLKQYLHVHQNLNLTELDIPILEKLQHKLY